MAMDLTKGEFEMTVAQVEHINITVPDGEKTAKMFCQLFDWHVRWSGRANDGGHSLHVGCDDTYIALYTPAEEGSSHPERGRLNHIGIIVDDLDLIEARVKSNGYTPYSHGDYEPGRRFYFRTEEHIEIEVISYAS